MKIAIMQPYFFPYIGYFQLIDAVDEFVILDNVTFIKKGWINRNTILLNSKIQKININIDNISQNRLIQDHRINLNESLKKKTLKQIKQSYSKAIHFNNVFPLIEEIILNKEPNLAIYLKSSIIKTCNFIGITTPIELSSNIYNKTEPKGENRIIEICKQRDADGYINAIGGKELYNHGSFKKRNISLEFIRTNAIKYKQFENEFIPNLSIIDVLMFCDKKQINDMICNTRLT